MSNASIFVELAPLRDRVEALLRVHLDTIEDRGGRRPPKRLLDAMRHALIGEAKRLRPLLVAVCSDVKAAPKKLAYVNDAATRAIIAVELVHTYSLIHDDLPALDDDDMRRGKASVHKAFDEATAILAGDALLSDAFAALATAPQRAAEQVLELALAIGSAGMVGGQYDDVVAANGDVHSERMTVEKLISLHERKTGRLFSASCALGGLSVGATSAQLDLMRRFGHHFGVAFQIADDLLDHAQWSKASAQDRTAEEQVNFATLLGPDAARLRAWAEAGNAVRIAKELGSDTLARLAHFAVERDE